MRRLDADAISLVERLDEVVNRVLLVEPVAQRLAGDDVLHAPDGDSNGVGAVALARIGLSADGDQDMGVVRDDGSMLRCGWSGG